MILVGQYDSPYVRRVAVSLQMLGYRFDRDTRSVFGDAEAIRAINPLGRIPALVLDGGEVLIDSAAILDWLDEQVGPERALLPPRGAERRRALQIMALATGILDKAGAIVYERTLRPSDKRYDAWLERCTTQVTSGLAALEAATGDGWYLGGEMRQPDVTVACVLGYFPLRAPELFVGYPKLAALLARAAARPEFAHTRPAEDEVMPDGLARA
ncbi:MAG: glutathione S-transferase N-terminal domain-containing protein [Deltaproteobacteria bacterium]|nr:glutathione S-transferase N-terminal domain-containing protein [Deltaproteobacteria bacterium]